MKIQKPEKNINFAKMERDILYKWDTENTFKQSVDMRSKDKKFNFYDGPPFATGLPHFGHFVPLALKDVFPRYFTMKGYRVERRWGWDCHGLPVEMLVQDELKLNGRTEIQEYGVAKFNEACRASVLRYTKEWEAYVKRYGRWVDMDNQYRTMDLPFMESVWAIFKMLFDKGLVYEGYKVLSYSCALNSTLSNSEASQEYQDVQDPSLTIKAKLKDNHLGKTLLVWTTTPWTLPANVAIAINPEAEYVEIKELSSKEHFYLMKERLISIWCKETDYVVVRIFKGQELLGVKYEPFFDSYVKEVDENGFKIVGGTFVLSDTGTGAVHIAPAFGQEDFDCAKQNNLPLIDNLDADGNMLATNITEVIGMNFKEADKLLIVDLKKRNLVLKHETLVHSYPMCYRSHKPLIYRAMPSWFVHIEKIKDSIIKSNEAINWVPEHLKEGRFGQWIKNARDWNIARERYWGNPIPLWKNDEGEIICIGSVAELEQYANRKITDLHLHNIDDIHIPSPTGKSYLKRVPYVFDCWFESGSMPYAQLHYPFENAEEFNDLFPADFICEGLDQTRGWFYNLNNLSSALFAKPAFKNVVVNGIILASDGRKMSKSLKNYADPMETLETYGADSVRLFLLASPASSAEECRFDIDGVKEITRKILLPLWNAYSFFATYATLDEFDPEKHLCDSKNELDIWALLRVNDLQRKVDASMIKYHIAEVIPEIVSFFDDLNNWYIRRNRRRFWSSEFNAYSTLYKVLKQACQILAPLAPFAAEYFYQKLSLNNDDLSSVHLTIMPDARILNTDEEAILRRVKIAQRIVESGRTLRTTHKIKNRQPLNSITVGLVNQEIADDVILISDTIKEELNVKKVEISLNVSSLAQIIVKPNLKILGKSLGAKLKEVQYLLANIDQPTAYMAKQAKVIKLGEFELQPEHLIIELKPANNKLVSVDGDIVVALDPEITEELKMEGLARELVSSVQKNRKIANFEVEDRIYLKVIALNPALNKAIIQNKNYIEDETLSSMVQNTTQNFEYTTDINIEDEQVKIFMSRK